MRWWWWCDWIMCDVHSPRFIYKCWMTAIRACRMRLLWCQSHHFIHYIIHNPLQHQRIRTLHLWTWAIYAWYTAIHMLLQWIMCWPIIIIIIIITRFRDGYCFIQWLAWPRPLNLSSSYVRNWHLMTILPFIVDCVSVRDMKYHITNVFMANGEKGNAWNHWVVTFDWL